MNEYKEMLKEITAQLSYTGSMIDFARAIRTCIETEMEKINPDQALIATLLNAGRIGWELERITKMSAGAFGGMLGYLVGLQLEK